MNIRLATINDLHQLKKMYGNIIDNMNKNNVQIWDDIYPCEFLEEDIEKERLYLVTVTEKDDIAAAFALSETNDGESYVKWKEAKAMVFYIDRLGVNVEFARQGIGGLTLKKAMELAKQKGAKYLRLFVVDINRPAINLYIKNGFQQVNGIYEEKIEDFVLREYGFEVEL